MRKGAQSYVCAKDADVVMTFLDISRAHSHVEVMRTLYAELLENILNITTTRWPNCFVTV